MAQRRNHGTIGLIPRIPRIPDLPDLPDPGQGGGGGGGGGTPEPPAGTDTPRSRRRYSLWAYKFHCDDESGLDDPGGWWVPGNPSDEVQWTITTKLNDQDSVTRGEHFGDLDSGDTRRFRSMVLAEDVSGPIGVSTQLIETDQGGGWNEKVSKAFESLEKIPEVGPWVAKVPEVVRTFIADFIGDDLIGSNSMLFRQSDLERHLPTIGSQWFVEEYFGGQGGDLPWAVAGGPDYRIVYRVLRVADAPLRAQQAHQVDQAQMVTTG